MGFSISWIGLSGLAKAPSLKLLGLRDTGMEDEANEAPLSCAETGLGWTIIWSNDIAFGDDQTKWSDLSTAAPVMVCFVEEHVMLSLAMLYENGEVKWSILHQGDGADVYHLEKSGSPPEIVSDIENEIFAKQKAEGGRNADVDFVFEIPLLTAKAITGFKHDELGASFTVVEKI